MAKITKLQDVKDSKKLKIILEDLENIVKIYTLSIQGLLLYKKYIPCQETLAMLKSNKMLLEIHLNKTKKIIENLK